MDISQVQGTEGRDASKENAALLVHLLGHPLGTCIFLVAGFNSHVLVQGQTVPHRTLYTTLLIPLFCRNVRIKGCERPDESADHTADHRPYCANNCANAEPDPSLLQYLRVPQPVRRRQQSHHARRRLERMDVHRL